VTAGFAIYDTMQYLSVPISTWCVGQACSMGALLLAAGSPTMRVALPHSRIMIHQPSGSVGVSILYMYVCMYVRFSIIQNCLQVVTLLLRVKLQILLYMLRR
jgi:hypothetical protein